MSGAAAAAAAAAGAASQCAGGSGDGGEMDMEGGAAGGQASYFAMPAQLAGEPVEKEIDWCVLGRLLQSSPRHRTPLRWWTQMVLLLLLFDRSLAPELPMLASAGMSIDSNADDFDFGDEFDTDFT